MVCGAPGLHAGRMPGAGADSTMVRGGEDAARLSQKILRVGVLQKSAVSFALFTTHAHADRTAGGSRLNAHVELHHLPNTVMARGSGPPSSARTRAKRVIGAQTRPAGGPGPAGP